MKEKLYTGDSVDGNGTVTGSLHINNDGVHFIIVRYEGVTTPFSWQVIPETVKEV